MLPPWESDIISVMLLNAALLALWPVLPVLIVCYVRQLLIARRTRPVFALRRSEANELQRAWQLFGRVCERIDGLTRQAAPRDGFWLTFRAPPPAAAVNADELDDLQAHAQHLQATIRRLTRLPLRRLNRWIHVRSSQFAWGVAIAAHLAALALLLALFHVFGPSAETQPLVAGTSRGVWYPFDERIFQANAVATAYACVTATLFYLVRRALLRRAYSLDFSFFRQFAKNGPAPESERPEPEQDADEPGGSNEMTEADNDSDWIAVLGISRQADLNEVKDAYKILIKKNHPDRVQDMSPPFRILAEAETKKINAAYRRALACVEGLEVG
jgi:DnaJ-like protein